MSKIKPVKAWAVLRKGKIERFGVRFSLDNMRAVTMPTERIIRVEIRPVTPKKKVRK